MRWPRRSAIGWPQPDFLPRVDRPTPLAWLWLVCGALVLAMAADDWLALDAARSEVRQLTDELRPAPVPVAARNSAGPVPAGALEAARTLSRRLDHPWRAVLEAAEQRAADDVRWLRLEHDGERGDLRLEAIAPSRDAMRETLEALAAAPGWEDAMLLRAEETVPPAPAGLRFELRARPLLDPPSGSGAPRK
jgi:hypothetical protein